MANYSKCKDALLELRARFNAAKSIPEQHVILNTAHGDPDLQECGTLQRWVESMFRNIVDYNLKKK